MLYIKLKEIAICSSSSHCYAVMHTLITGTIISGALSPDIFLTRQKQCVQTDSSACFKKLCWFCSEESLTLAVKK